MLPLGVEKEQLEPLVLLEQAVTAACGGPFWLPELDCWPVLDWFCEVEDEAPNGPPSWDGALKQLTE